MTDDQFQAIVEYVTERLESESSFAIQPEDFCEMFELSRPYYSDFLDRLRAQKSPLFGCDAPWKDVEGDPSDPIRFSRR